MARPTREDSIYRVALHKNGGYMYATTHPYTMTDDGKRKYSMLHWSTVTPELKFVPGKQYLYASVEERKKLIFPEGWDLSEIDKLSSNHKQGRKAYEGEDVNRFYGDVWLLEQVAAKVGLTKDLTMGFDRQRNWSEEGKTGRLFILLVALIISSYVRHIWKSTELKDEFGSTLDVLDEMRFIRCVEHKGKLRHITPFVGGQVDICKAFGIDIPEGCAPLYRSRKAPEKRRGRPKKPQAVKLES